MFYYLLTTAIFAATIAVTGIVTEVGTKYVARYFIENESQDFGINPPSTGDAKPAQVRTAPTRDASIDKNGLDKNGLDKNGKPREVVGASSAVLPILMSNPDAGTALASRSASAGEAVPSSYRVAALLNAGQKTDGILGAGLPASQAPIPGAVPTAAHSSAAEPAAATPEVAPEAPAALPIVPPQAQPQAALDLIRDTPHRRPDGSAFLPMSTQRVFSVRWKVCSKADVAMAFEIPGHVITDPSVGTTVNAALAGIIESNQGTFPFLGMRVRRGDLLAYLQPTVTVSERAQIEARVQQLSNQITLAEKQMERLAGVLFVRYRTNKIEAQKVQIEGYRRELLSLQSALERRESLRATADGVISKVGAVVGSTVNQGQILFEIVDPEALWVEAAAYDAAIAENIRTATAITGDGKPIPLEFIGGGMTLSNQAIPLRFRVVGPHEGLSVGKPVTVIVQQNKTIAGIPVPASSVIRDGDGRSIVWERTGAETFVPRQVRATRVAGNQMVVESGLANGARVVTEGASLLNQIR
ncbi:HlyD family efflux transporter periplasmic adaptor subunit [Starkeya sp. ORNL1]|uniref:efflux RND transporter periplasmic adaptor subunit n=1 Tax=Starkeya sp. ORNL1 TaxID=2709380 RepID=UPI001462CECE|nr:HlyD family efflux transporter periplasmic adaptor subunit [Starkeya sp. ORNL1]QJP13441.1 HlyD family efflux transporter periplasmic adaptor subunit [Starkeya sp. ORNL1]